MLFFICNNTNDTQACRRTRLFVLSINGLIILQPPVFGRQEAVQLLDKFEKCLPILLDRDLGAKLLNAVAIRLIHKRSGSITVFAVLGMFDVERCGV